MPAVEVMVSTALIRDYIVNEDKTSSIREAIANGASQYNMQTFDQSLFQLLQTRQITYEEAIHNATNADEFKMRVQGIYSADDTLAHMTTPTTMTSHTQSKVAPPTISSEPESIFVFERFRERAGGRDEGLRDVVEPGRHRWRQGRLRSG